MAEQSCQDSWMMAASAALLVITQTNVLMATLPLELSIVESYSGTYSDTEGSCECICDVGYELNTDNTDPTCVNIDVTQYS